MERSTIIAHLLEQLTRANLIYVLSIVELFVVNHFLREYGEHKEFLFRIALIIFKIRNGLMQAFLLWSLVLSLVYEIRVLKEAAGHLMLIIFVAELTVFVQAHRHINIVIISVLDLHVVTIDVLLDDYITALRAILGVDIALSVQRDDAVGEA